MADDDAPEEGGLEPADEEAIEVPAEEAVAEEAAEEEVYTRSQLAEMLPNFDRFATHEGEEAFRQYGQAYDNARRLISTGGHMTRQEEEAYRAAGIDPEEVPTPAEPEYEAPGLFGTPWDPPTTWDEVNAYAQSDDPNARRLAAEAVLAEPKADEATKRAYFNNWAAIDPYGAAAYSQQAVIERMQEQQAELERRLEERDAPLHSKHADTIAGSIVATAKAEIKGFEEHSETVAQIMAEREARYPGYGKMFVESDPKWQLNEFRELTYIAAQRTAPARKAAQQAALDAADAAKRGQVTETGRTNGQPETEQSAMKRRSVEDAKRVGGRVY